ncbi:hypothetical protein [Mucilaginibacter rubeus]|uniref:Addiction module toxin RelE n=1 Tax=Mucilaginibacter rubeus TaxID=2027860 RepID=A0A5C1HS81_9SPHI|nr:hypothetical protein [Mucilaginibacter rubeus]QEM08742.1 hypothetical protein DEO27_001485 [Mucilaginibacter rubeus]
MSQKKAKIFKSLGNRHIAFDVDAKEDIIAFIKSKPIYNKKFNLIIDVILQNLRVPDLFDKEDIDNKSKDVWAMKFLKGGDNPRIYCKEVRTADKNYVIVAAAVLEKKKNQKNKAKEISLIHQVAENIYTIIEPKKENT